MRQGRLVLFLLLPVIIFLSFNKHSQDGNTWYRKVIFSDAAGYYSYLPFWFSDGPETEIFPDSILARTGKGFSLTEDGKLHTKYTCGVALLQLPFYLGAELFTGDDHPGSSFTAAHYHAVSLAGAFYGWMGFFLLYLVLRDRFSEWIAVIVPLVVFLATNLYWYAVDNGGMSHVYSFFLVSAFLYIVQRLVRHPSYTGFLMLGLVSGMIVLVRPLNVVILLMFFFTGVNGKPELQERIRFLFANARALLISLAAAILLFVPQFIYWSYRFGTPFAWSYEGESFDNLGSPYLFHVLFSTNNGLITWTPVVLLFLAGIFAMVWKGYRESMGILIVFIISWYLFSSWWSWHFGCAYGARSFVELYPLLATGLAWLLASAKKWPVRAGILALAAAFSALNLAMIYYYPGCFEAGNWDWNEYFRLLSL